MTTTKEQAVLRDALRYAQFDLSRELKGHDPLGLFGFGIASLRDGDGALKQVEPFCNLITDVGDAFIAQKVGNGINSQTISFTNPNGMKLASVTLTPAKNSTGSWIPTASYISGSNVGFDSGYPTATIVSAGNGWTTNFQTTWGAGVATASVYACEICSDQATNAGHSAATATLATTAWSVITKGASDSLTVTWKWTAKGT